MKYPALAVITVAFALAVLSPESALAGPYGDELAKCLVKSTTDADKTYLVKWLFAAAALHPDVKSIASVSDAQRDELNKNAAKLFERLLTESCRSRSACNQSSISCPCWQPRSQYSSNTRWAISWSGRFAD